MKSLRLFILAIMCCLTFTMCSAQRELQEISNLSGVQSVFVGKAMLSLASSYVGSELNTPGFDGTKLMKNISSIEIVTTDNKKTSAKALSILDHYITSNKLETLTEITDGDQQVIISGEVDEDSGNIKKILIRVTEPSEMVCLLLKCNITPEMLQEAMKK